MKKMLFLVLLLVFALPALAQQPEYEFAPHKRLPEYEFKLPDSLAHMTPWVPVTDHQPQVGLPIPVAAMTSVVVLKGRKVPKRVAVIENNVLATPRLTISNGQAWNWGPYPNSYLDARTIIMPMPR